MTITVTVSNTTFTQLRNKVNQVIGVVNTLGTGNVSNTYLQATFATKAYAASNTAVRLLISDRLQVSNAAAIYQTKTVERAALANTNAFIKAQLANTNIAIASKASWSALTGTNTALRILINDRLQVANANNKYATKAYAAANTYVKQILANTNSYIASVAAAASPSSGSFDYGFIISAVTVQQDYGTL